MFRQLKVNGTHKYRQEKSAYLDGTYVLFYTYTISATFKNDIRRKNIPGQFECITQQYYVAEKTFSVENFIILKECRKSNLSLNRCSNGFDTTVSVDMPKRHSVQLRDAVRQRGELNNHVY